MTKRSSGGSLAFLSGVGLGTGLMYMFDPDAGARRRALLRDQLIHSEKLLENTFEKGSRDLLHRARGLWAVIARSFSSDQIGEHTIEERVRSALGRCVSHPRAIKVSATQGDVVLSGTILKSELEQMLLCIGGVRGVASIDHRDLQIRDSAEHVPELQGGRERIQRRGFARENWSPSLRLITTAGGFLFGAYGYLRGGLIGTALAGAGAAFLLRGGANVPVKRVMSGLPITVRKTITVRAPIGEVFSFWSNMENFPRFMQHVREVSRTGDRTSHWVVAGPAGLPVSWEAETTQVVENKIVGWRTVPGSTVEHRGVVHFESAGEGATRLHIQMAYRPPAGILGHSVASLFRVDPKHAMDEDLIRMKSLLEEGKATAHGHKVRRSELS